MGLSILAKDLYHESPGTAQDQTFHAALDAAFFDQLTQVIDDPETVAGSCPGNGHRSIGVGGEYRDGWFRTLLQPSA